MENKCKFWKKCEKYNDISHTCNRTNGMYYADGTKPAGCFKKMGDKK